MAPPPLAALTSAGSHWTNCKSFLLRGQNLLSLPQRLYDFLMHAHTLGL